MDMGLLPHFVCTAFCGTNSVHDLQRQVTFYMTKRLLLVLAVVAAVVALAVPALAMPPYVGGAVTPKY